MKFLKFLGWAVLVIFCLVLAMPVLAFLALVF
jgi:hypothetical protein